VRKPPQISAKVRVVSAPERIVPDATEPGIVALHEKRYAFALSFCAGKDVLDAGCGVGYGSAILAGAARRVVGVDRSEEAISYARERYARPNVEFVVDDLLELGQPDGEFDVVCAF
jgi:2-polyprenyl-3-methyl-5-hydroxy-6-metoxy-1,4-benzoquinol methylase